MSFTFIFPLFITKTLSAVYYYDTMSFTFLLFHFIFPLFITKIYTKSLQVSLISSLIQYVIPWCNAKLRSLGYASRQHLAEQSDFAALHSPPHFLVQRCGNDSSSSQFQVYYAWLTGHNRFSTLLQRHRRCKCSQFQAFVTCSASHTKPNECPKFSFVHEDLGKKGTLSRLLGDVNLNVNVKHKPDLKSKFTVKIGGTAAPQCLHTSHHWLGK